MVVVAAESARSPVNPETFTTARVASWPYGSKVMDTSLPSDQRSDNWRGCSKCVTVTLSLAPGTMNSQVTVAPGASGPLAYDSQNFRSIDGCTKALNTAAGGRRMSIVAREELSMTPPEKTRYWHESSSLQLRHVKTRLDTLPRPRRVVGHALPAHPHRGGDHRSADRGRDPHPHRRVAARANCGASQCLGACLSQMASPARVHAHRDHRAVGVARARRNPAQQLYGGTARGGGAALRGHPRHEARARAARAAPALRARARL